MEYPEVTFPGLRDKRGIIEKTDMTTKISFLLPSDKTGEATAGMILGDFNNWNPEEGIYLRKQDDGSMVAELYLTPGKTYQYRYLLNDGRWVNDHNQTAWADAYGYPVENCVITVQQPEKKKKAPVKKAVEAKDKGVSMLPDDLTRIEGIGKKIMKLLNEENILTYKDLGKTTIKKLKTLLEAAGNKYSMHDPATWPKQAKLAAAGKWDELRELQAQLKAGK